MEDRTRSDSDRFLQYVTGMTREEFEKLSPEEQIRVVQDSYKRFAPRLFVGSLIMVVLWQVIIGAIGGAIARALVADVASDNIDLADVVVYHVYIGLILFGTLILPAFIFTRNLSNMKTKQDFGLMTVLWLIVLVGGAAAGFPFAVSYLLSSKWELDLMDMVKYVYLLYAFVLGFNWILGAIFSRNEDDEENEAKWKAYFQGRAATELTNGTKKDDIEAQGEGNTKDTRENGPSCGMCAMMLATLVTYVVAVHVGLILEMENGKGLATVLGLFYDPLFVPVYSYIESEALLMANMTGP